MKLYLFNIILFSLLIVSCNSESDAANNDSESGQNYHFWVSLEQAQEMAYDEGKHIVLDVYTEWCGFCRRMNKETYGDERVQEALDRYFYPVRINAESDEQITFLGESYTKRELAIQFGVSSYPTTIFITPDGEPVAVQPGFIDAALFSKMLSYVGSESYQTMSFQEYSESN